MRQVGEQGGELYGESALVGGRRTEPFRFQGRMRAAIEVELREEAIGLVARAAAAEEEAEAAVGLADLAPPGESRAEGAPARPRRQGLGDDHLAALGTQRSFQP